jgi:hypothetical protein
MPQLERRAVVARITGKREEYISEGIPDPEDIWGEEAEQEFIEVGAQLLAAAAVPMTLDHLCPLWSRLYRPVCISTASFYVKAE